MTDRRIEIRTVSRTDQATTESVEAQVARCGRVIVGKYSRHTPTEDIKDLMLTVDRIAGEGGVGVVISDECSIEVYELGESAL